MSYRFDTLAIHAGQPNDAATGAVTVPVYQTSTFSRRAGRQPRLRLLAHRSSDAARARREPGGARGRTLRPGVLQRNGRHSQRAVDCSAPAITSSSTQDLYGGAWRIFTKYFAKFGIEFTFVDTTISRRSRARSAPRRSCSGSKHHRTRCSKSPISPRAQPSRAAHGVAPSSTTRSPRRCCSSRSRSAPTSSCTRPPSTSTATATASAGVLSQTTMLLYDNMKFLQNAIGAVPGPQDCFLILRGIKTLRCAWSGIARTPQGRRVSAQPRRGEPRLLSGLRRDRRVRTAIRSRSLAKRLKLWTLAESLGSVKSLFCHPATMTHASMEPEVRKSVGIGDGLIRLSVGLEDAPI